MQGSANLILRPEQPGNETAGTTGCTPIRMQNSVVLSITVVSAVLTSYDFKSKLKEYSY